MIDQNIHSQLFRYCSWGINFNEKIKEILSYNKNIDILYREGGFLHFAIKHDNLKLLNMLIEYYEENILKPIEGTEEYNKAKYKLSEVLYKITESLDIKNPEIQGVLNKYIEIFDNNSSNGEENLPQVDEGDFIVDESLLDEQRTYNSVEHNSFLTLTEANLANFNKSFEAESELETYENALSGNEVLDYASYSF